MRSPERSESIGITELALWHRTPSSPEILSYLQPFPYSPQRKKVPQTAHNVYYVKLDAIPSQDYPNSVGRRLICPSPGEP